MLSIRVGDLLQRCEPIGPLVRSPATVRLTDMRCDEASIAGVCLVVKSCEEGGARAQMQRRSAPVVASVSRNPLLTRFERPDGLGKPALLVSPLTCRDQQGAKGDAHSCHPRRP